MKRPKLIPHTGWRRRKMETALLRFIAWLLKARNGTRSGVISRRDNNDTWYMADRLESIADRISSGYDQVGS